MGLWCKNKKDLSENVDLLPGFLKTTTLGYDGKGQYKLHTEDDITDEIDFTKEYILEKLIHLKKEISVVITRYDQNSYEIYEPIENVHEEQILKYSTIPEEMQYRGEKLGVATARDFTIQRSANTSDGLNVFLLQNNKRVYDLIENLSNWTE